jgi:hypothetical protein
MSKAVTAIQIQMETRPKNAGVHRDQLKKVATRSNRRAGKQNGWKDYR